MEPVNNPEINKTDKLFTSKLGKASAAHRPDLWSEMEARLTAEQPGAGKKAFPYGYLLAACTLPLLAAGLLYFVLSAPAMKPASPLAEIKTNEAGNFEVKQAPAEKPAADPAPLKSSLAVNEDIKFVNQSVAGRKKATKPVEKPREQAVQPFQQTKRKSEKADLKVPVKAENGGQAASEPEPGMILPQHLKPEPQYVAAANTPETTPSSYASVPSLLADTGTADYIQITILPSRQAVTALAQPEPTGKKGNRFNRILAKIRQYKESIPDRGETEINLSKLLARNR